LNGPFGTRYVGDMDRMFDSYSTMVESVTEHIRKTVKRDSNVSDFVFKQATRAKGLDAVRGVLPAASLSNLGIYGTGQGYEALLLRMRGHNLPEARLYADLMLTELRKVVPSFLRRVDVADRGGRWTNYLAEREGETVELVDEYFGALDPNDSQEVVLTDFDPDGEDKLLAAICYSSSHLPESQLMNEVRELSHDR
ncbi:MAG: thymidylate synthase, partial [Acidimicrobiaceae bacterium]